MEKDFTHFNEQGRAKMVDVGEKPVTTRTAVAAARVLVNRDSFERIRTGGMKKGDVLLLISNSGRNTTPVEMAMLAREKGVHTICLTSVAHSSSVTPRNPAGKRLMEVCDLVIDNMGVPGDAVVETGDGRRVSPTSTVIGAALLQAVSARAEEIARQEGKTLEYFISSNVDGGDAYNEKLIERYQKQVPCL